MHPNAPTLIILHGSAGEGLAERMVARTRVACGLESARRALAAGYARVIIATDEPRAFPDLPSTVTLDADSPGAGFAFQLRVASLIRDHAIRRPVVMGAGSLPLAEERDFRTVADALTDGDRLVVTNNFFSSDLTGWTPGDAVDRLRDVPRDNVLPRRLRDQAGFATVTLPRTTRTHFDLDTPADLAVLALREGLPEAIAHTLTEAPLPLAPYRAVMRMVCDPKAELVVTGRVGSAAWPYLESETACRVRLISEERGLAAAGPAHRARSVLGFLLEEVGVEGFFHRVAELGDALVIDTRVIEAHLGIEPSREDRFQSDLLNPGTIVDPFLREFTQAAVACGKPVLLGGHSLVSGGLMALTDAAWLANDRLRGVPAPSA